MFLMNNYVITKKGIGKIIDVQDDYHVELYHSQQQIRISEDDIIREIFSQEVIEEMIDRIAYICTFSIDNEKMRKDIYCDAMNEYDEISWVKVIKSTYLRNKQKKAKDFEKRMAKEAKEFLYGEISILLNIPYKNVEKYIIEKVRNDEWS